MWHIDSNTKPNTLNKCFWTSHVPGVLWIERVVPSSRTAELGQVEEAKLAPLSARSELRLKQSICKHLLQPHRKHERMYRWSENSERLDRSGRTEVEENQWIIMNLLSWLPVGWRVCSWENDASKKSFHRCNGRSMELSWNGPTQAYIVLVTNVTGLRCGTCRYSILYSWTTNLTWARFWSCSWTCSRSLLPTRMPRARKSWVFFGMRAVDEIMPGLSVHLLTKHIMAI